MFGPGVHGGRDILWTLAGLFYGVIMVVVLIALVGVIVLLVRFLLVGTKAAQLYVANNSAPASPAGERTHGGPVHNAVHDPAPREAPSSPVNPDEPVAPAAPVADASETVAADAPVVDPASPPVSKARSKAVAKPVTTPTSPVTDTTTPPAVTKPRTPRAPRTPPPTAE